MESSTIVFIDAENVSSKAFEDVYKKKITKFAKNHDLKLDEIEYRAYAVEGGPTSRSWKSDGVSMKKVPGDPASNKADNQIAKELYDQAGREKVCILLTHDKGLRKIIDETMNDVYMFGD